jgi:hypothetical protein
MFALGLDITKLGIRGWAAAGPGVLGGAVLQREGIGRAFTDALCLLSSRADGSGWYGSAPSVLGFAVTRTSGWQAQSPLAK